MTDQDMDAASPVPSEDGQVLAAAPDRETIALAIAAAAEHTPGVHALQPTLDAAVLRRLIWHHRVDGVHVLIRGDLVNVDVNIAILATQQARAVATHVHDAATAVVRANGYSPGATTVNVLVIQPPPT